LTDSTEHQGDAGEGRPATQVYADELRPLEEPELDGLRRAVCADALARFLRNRGRDVRFAVAARLPDGSDSGRDERVRGRLDALELGYDRYIRSSDPDSRRRLQALFLDLLAGDLVYPEAAAPGDQASSSWLMRSNGLAARCERAIERLAGTAATREAQREALGKVEGVELRAALLGVGELTVFTAHPDAVAEARFVAVSPRHPDIRSMVSEEALESLSRDSGAPPSVPTGLQAAVPGVEDVVPVVLTTAAEPLAPAALGVPSRDAVDSSIAERLQAASSLPFRAKERGSSPSPVTRYRLPDLPVSRAGAGTAIPILCCRDCGAVPVPRDELPFTGSWEAGCPTCGGESTPHPQVLTPEFEGMWMWALAEAAPEGATGGGNGAEPPELAIVGDGDGRRLLHQCLSGELLRQIRSLPEEGSSGLVGAAALVGRVKEGEDGFMGVADLDRAIASKGADAVRFALLDMAAPATSTGLGAHSVIHAERFVDELRRYAAPRLRAYEEPRPLAVDPGTRLRRRLRAWCRAAAARIEAAFTEMQFHRVTHNLGLLLRRIEDFERRVAQDGALGPEDREAVVFALGELVGLSSACVPGVAAELEPAAAAGWAPTEGAGLPAGEG
jgi:leucyl-tRNA synthetase